MLPVNAFLFRGLSFGCMRAERPTVALPPCIHIVPFPFVPLGFPPLFLIRLSLAVESVGWPGLSPCPPTISLVGSWPGVCSLLSRYAAGFCLCAWEREQRLFREIKSVMKTHIFISVYFSQHLFCSINLLVSSVIQQNSGHPAVLLCDANGFPCVKKVCCARFSAL